MSEVEEQAVVVYIYADALPGGILKLNDLHKLEDQIEEAIDLAGVGEFDGDEIGGSDAGLPAATIYMYGPDAERLFSAIEFVLSKSVLAVGARVLVRYGGPDAEGRMVTSSELA